MNDPTFFSALQGILTSKKHLTAIATVIVLIAQDVFGLELSIETIVAISSTAFAAILGQGIADNGKESAKLEIAREEQVALEDSR